MLGFSNKTESNNSLQEIFLNRILQQLNFNSEIHKHLFKRRYNPKNQGIKLATIAREIKNSDQIYFEEACINTFAARVNKKIVEIFEEEMRQDGINLTLNIFSQKREKNSSSLHIPPFQTVYQWLWEKKFPREGWKLAKEIAVPAFKELNMVDIETARRGLNIDVIPNDDYFIQLNKSYCLQMNLSCQKQYLVLINESVEGEFYLLSPSIAFADIPYTVLSENLCLPLNDGRKGRAPFFQYETEGNEYFLAIVTKQPIELSWIHWESDPRDVILNQKRFEEIFIKVGQQSDSQVFYKRFRAVK